MGDTKQRKFGDYDRWFELCVKCGFDSGKSSEKSKAKCWKCGEHLARDYSNRALKEGKLK